MIEHETDGDTDTETGKYSRRYKDRYAEEILARFIAKHPFWIGAVLAEAHKKGYQDSEHDIAAYLGRGNSIEPGYDKSDPFGATHLKFIRKVEDDANVA